MEKKRIKKKVILNIIVIIIFVWVILALLPRPKSVSGVNPLVIKTGAKPVLIAHGGGNKEFPDNTLEAFYNAYRVDSTCMMETDVSLTKDGVIILSHDTTLDRKTNLINKNIIDVNYSDLMAEEVSFGYENEVSPKSNGYNVSGKLSLYKNYLNELVTPQDVNYPEGVTPRHDSVFLATTLEELIKAFPNNLINVEIKQAGEVGLKALDAVIKLMDRLDGEYHTYQRIVLASFHSEVYQKLINIQKSNPNLMYSPEAKGVTKFFILQLLKLDVLYNDKITVLQVPMSQSGINLASKSFINAAHKHNISVNYWTIDNKEDMKILIKNGADGIMTNIPSLLKSVYDEYFK